MGARYEVQLGVHLRLCGLQGGDWPGQEEFGVLRRRLLRIPEGKLSGRNSPYEKHDHAMVHQKEKREELQFQKEDVSAQAVHIVSMCTTNP